MKIFSVLDIKAGCYMKPFADLNTASALRSFCSVTNEKDSTFHKFPDDFALCEIAEFDMQNGVLTPFDNPINLGSARTVLNSHDEQIRLAQ